MSTITDAIKKRKKEAGEEETQELIPVDLEEPDVEVPKEKSVRRVVFLTAACLLVAGAVVCAAILWKDMFGGKSVSDKTDQPVRAASLPRPEGSDVLPGREAEEALPLPEASPQPELAPAEKEPAKPEAPSPGRPPTPESPSPPVGETPPSAAPTPPPKDAPTVEKQPGTVSEPPPVAKADPFAGIKLQGIVRFNPTAPEVLINGKALKVGDSLDGIEVVEIGDAHVKLRHGNIEKTIRYR